MRTTPQHVAEGAIDRLCEGDPQQTANNIAEFQLAFVQLALQRMSGRILTQAGVEENVIDDLTIQARPASLAVSASPPNEGDASP